MNTWWIPVISRNILQHFILSHIYHAVNLSAKFLMKWWLALKTFLRAEQLFLVNIWYPNHLIPLEARNTKLSTGYLSLTLLQRTKLITNLLGISTTQLLGRQWLCTTKIALLTQLKTIEKLDHFSKRQPISIPLTPLSLKSL